MPYFIGAALALQLFALSPLVAQQSTSWLVRGDTTGAPPGCSAAAGIAALTEFVAAMNNVDSMRLSRAVAPTFLLSTGRFIPGEPFVRAEGVAAVLRYARERAHQHERLRLQAVTFNGWRGKVLQFGPIYVRRTAGDLGGRPLYGDGKGGYVCGQGLAKINLGPRRTLRPGERMRADQEYPPDIR
jgi:hypothetical protein